MCRQFPEVQYEFNSARWRNVGIAGATPLSGSADLLVMLHFLQPAYLAR